jgi:hypothetical protein
MLILKRFDVGLVRCDKYALGKESQDNCEAYLTFGELNIFMYLWPTYYTLEIRVYIPTLPLF